MNQFKRAQVVILPSENPQVSHKGDIYLSYHSKSLPNCLSIVKSKPNSPTSYRKECIKQHLYIISDDEIKEGDWFMLNEEHPQGRLRQCYHISDNNRLWNGENWDTLKGKHYFIQPIGKGSGFVTELECKKIIATTDISLKIPTVSIPKELGYSYSLPQPSQQFIEKYIESYNKGEVITDILVEYEEGKYNIDELRERHLNKLPHSYGYDNLKINPKDNTITIKKLKDSWNREEVVILLNKLNNTLNIGSELTLEQWIENNL